MIVIDWNIITCFIALISALAAWRAAHNTKEAAKLQAKISLYDARYTKLYKPLLDIIDELSSNAMGGKALSMEYAKQFFDNLSYSKYLVKESDFQSIMQKYNDIVKVVIDFQTKKDIAHRTKNFNAYNDKVAEWYRYIAEIMNPYLQIEKENICKKLSHKFIKLGKKTCQLN